MGLKTSSLKNLSSQNQRYRNTIGGEMDKTSQGTGEKTEDKRPPNPAGSWQPNRGFLETKAEDDCD